MFPAPSDAELMAAHRTGDRDAFGLLAGRYTDGMWRLALRTLHHPEDAADAVQEALVAAFRRAGDYRGEASVRTWLHRIVVNTCIDRLRLDRRRPVALSLGDTEPPARRRDPASEVATRMAVDDALLELPVEQRVAVLLVDVEGWPVAEAAAILDIPIGTVKSRCARGRSRLAVLLGHLREEER